MNRITPTISSAQQLAPSPSFLYVANSASSSVSVVNVNNNSVVGRISVGNNPTRIAISSDHTRIYVLNQSDGTVSVIDTSNNAVVTTIGVGPASNQFDMVISPNGSRLYISNPATKDVTVVDTGSNTVIATVPTASDPFPLAVSPDNSKVYAVINPDTIQIIDTASNTISGSFSIPSSDYSSLSFNLSGTRLYLGGISNETITVIDTSNNTILSGVAVGGQVGSQHFTFDSSGTRLFAVAHPCNVSMIDTTNNTWKAVFPFSIQTCSEAVVNSAGSRIYAITANSVEVIDATRNATLGIIPLLDRGASSIVLKP